MSWLKRTFFRPYVFLARLMLTLLSEMGLMHITGARDGPPVKVGVAVTDLTTGLYTSNSIIAALFRRLRNPSSKGQHIDVALSDCQVATLANIASSCLISGKRDTGRWGTSHPSIVPYKAFKTSDGDILLGGGNDRLYGVLCNKLGKPEWIVDDRFKTNALRVQHRDELEELIERETRKKSTQELLDLLEGSGMRKYHQLYAQLFLTNEYSIRCYQRRTGYTEPRTRYVCNLCLV
jgi:crotonobetainyl-CoA:carnitine CoA-transferase CaiB-like acyl-CoA transferase